MKIFTTLIIISFVLFFNLEKASGNEACNIDLTEWLKCNNPIVEKYLTSLNKTDIGKTLAGVNLTDKTKELEGYIFLGKVINVPSYVKAYLFEVKEQKVSYLWVEADGKEFSIPRCGNGALPLSPYVLSGDVYTWAKVQPGHGVIKLNCPPAEWQVK